MSSIESRPAKFRLSTKYIAAPLAATALLLAGCSESGGNASANNEPQQVANIAAKIIQLYKKNQHNPNVAFLTGPRVGMTDVNVELPSVYGSFDFIATVSSLDKINPNTVSGVVAQATFPNRYSSTDALLGARYRLELDNGQLEDASANYISGAGTEYLYLSGNYSGFTAVKYGATLPPPAQHNVAVPNDQSTNEHIINGITDIVDRLLVTAPRGVPVATDTVTPSNPLIPNFK